MNLNFHRAVFSAQMVPLLKPLVEANDLETPLMPFKINPDWDRYEALEGGGFLRLYLAQDAETGRPVGYQEYVLGPHPHYSVTVAACQAFFLLPPARGFALSFLAWAEKQLAEDGARFVLHEAPVLNLRSQGGMDALAHRRGYALLTRRYGKELGVSRGR